MRGRRLAGLAVAMALQCCMGLHVFEGNAMRKALGGSRAEEKRQGGIVHCRRGEGGRADGRGNCAVELQEDLLLERNYVSNLNLRGGSSVATKVKPAKNPRFEAVKHAAVWTAKGVSAAFTGLLTTSSVMVAFEFTAHKLHPAAIAAARVPDTLAVMVLIGAIVGSVLGSLVLSKLAPSQPSAIAFVVSSLFTAAQYLNIQTIDHPAWFNIAGMCAFVPPYVATALLTRGGATKLWKMIQPAKRDKKLSERTASPAKSVKYEAKTPSKPKSSHREDSEPPKSSKKVSKSSSKTPKKRK